MDNPARKLASESVEIADAFGRRSKAKLDVELRVAMRDDVAKADRASH